MSTPLVPRRRDFLKGIAAAALAAPFVTRGLLAAPPSRRLRHASFGASGMAWSDIQAICSNPFVDLVAVAEVDPNRLTELKGAYPNVKVYQDWRELLDREQGNIDSVNVSTPDHLHAPITMAALQLGKHVYCEKPLTHDLHEARAVTEFARGKPLVTQMGIQIHSMKVYRQAVALVQGGAIGKVKEVHAWSSKKWGDRGPPPANPTDPLPPGFDWELWLGGQAPRPFVGNGYYHPKNWRKRLDFGTGTFGDMGCHIFDPVFEALALTAPLSLYSEGPAPDAWNWAQDARIRYVFPGTKYTVEPTVTVWWYDGDARPPAEVRNLIAVPPEEAARLAAADPKQKRRDAPNEGSIIIGTEGVLHVPHIATPRLFPREKFKDYPLPDVVGTHHWSDWAEACVGGPGKPTAHFDYAGPLTESVLLGTIAVRFPQTKLEWNAAKLTFDNVAAANKFLRREYRPGWRIAGL